MKSSQNPLLRASSIEFYPPCYLQLYSSRHSVFCLGYHLALSLLIIVITSFAYLSRSHSSTCTHHWCGSFLSTRTCRQSGSFSSTCTHQQSCSFLPTYTHHVPVIHTLVMESFTLVIFICVCSLVRRYFDLSWPLVDVLDILVKKSSGQLYALTVVKYVSSIRQKPADRLNVILGIQQSCHAREMPFGNSMRSTVRDCLSTAKIWDYQDLDHYLNESKTHGYALLAWASRIPNSRRFHTRHLLQWNFGSFLSAYDSD